MTHLFSVLHQYHFCFCKCSMHAMKTVYNVLKNALQSEKDMILTTEISGKKIVFWFQSHSGLGWLAKLSVKTACTEKISHICFSVLYLYLCLILCLSHQKCKLYILDSVQIITINTFIYYLHLFAVNHCIVTCHSQMSYYVNNKVFLTLSLTIHHFCQGQRCYEKNWAHLKLFAIGCLTCSHI